MANEEHLAILRQGVEVWNRWRGEHQDVQPDLDGISLKWPFGELKPDYDKDIGSVINLSGINFSRSSLIHANLSNAVLCAANFSGANLERGNLQGSDLRDANFNKTNLLGVNLLLPRSEYGLVGRRTRLTGAILLEANLLFVDFSDLDLTGSNFSFAEMGMTKFNRNDLSQVIGLDTIVHRGPSSIGMDTLYQSRGNIPEVFLRGCGVPQAWIDYLPYLIGAMQPIQFYSCFISYSSKDEDFARRLYSQMYNHHLRVWFADEDMKAGQKIHEQIDQAIRVYDKLVLVLSEQSIQSEWVMTEIRKARKAELRDGRRKLFPIRLVDMNAIRQWECFDADTGKDLAVEVREYFIPDFTQWKDHDSFERAFARFLKDLQATEAPPIPRAPEKMSADKTSGKTRPQNPQTIIARKKRRLAVLEEQQAIKGISTPPEVITEIEDLRREIEELDA